MKISPSGKKGGKKRNSSHQKLRSMRSVTLEQQRELDQLIKDEKQQFEQIIEKNEKLSFLHKTQKIGLKPSELRMRAQAVDTLFMIENLKQNEKVIKRKDLLEVQNLKSKNRLLELDSNLNNIDRDVKRMTLKPRDARYLAKMASFPMIDDKKIFKESAEKLSKREFSALEASSSKDMSKKFQNLNFSKLEKSIDSITKKKSKRYKVQEMCNWFSKQMKQISAVDYIENFSSRFQEINSVLSYIFKEMVEERSRVCHEEGLLLYYLYLTMVTLLTQFHEFTQKVQEKVQENMTESANKKLQKKNKMIEELRKKLDSSHEGKDKLVSDNEHLRELTNRLNYDLVKSTKLYTTLKQKINGKNILLDTYAEQDEDLGYLINKTGDYFNKVSDGRDEEDDAKNILNELLVVHKNWMKNLKNSENYEKRNEVSLGMNILSATPRRECIKYDLKHVIVVDKKIQTDLGYFGREEKTVQTVAPEPENLSSKPSFSRLTSGKRASKVLRRRRASSVLLRPGQDLAMIGLNHLVRSAEKHRGRKIERRKVSIVVEEGHGKRIGRKAKEGSSRRSSGVRV